MSSLGILTFVKKIVKSQHKLPLRYPDDNKNSNLRVDVYKLDMTATRYQ